MTSDSLERDIDLVLVTGAGASRAFGVNDTQLPLMREWSEHLVQQLAAKSSGYLAATGLESRMAPEAFEAQLGRFLRSVEGFNRIQPLLEPASAFQASRVPLVNAEQWNGWHANTAFHLVQVIGVIHLYALFSAQAVDLGAAEDAYGPLLRYLGIGVSSRVVYATTNYDTIGEDAIAALGGLPDVGDIQSSPFGNERSIRVDGLLDGMPRYVPVLHLHGRVGWLRRQDGRPYSTSIRAYDANFGVPIVMLPDLEKDYETDPVISVLWQQFVEALRRARRVLVLGHSLHDEALIQALVENVDPQERVAVTVLASPDRPDEPADDEEVASVAQRVADRLAGARLIPMRFQRHLGAPQTLQEWLARVEALGT